jgi:hypothetical protein
VPPVAALRYEYPPGALLLLPLLRGEEVARLFFPLSKPKLAGGGVGNIPRGIPGAEKAYVGEYPGNIPIVDPL